MTPLLAVAMFGAGCLAYGVAEARRYRVRAHRTAVLPPGASTVRMLQVSDLHLRRSMRGLSEFLLRLAEEEYDLVIATGDLLGEPSAAERCTQLLNGLRGRCGRYFVLGSADYYAPKFKNYLDYFTGRRPVGVRPNRTEALRSGLLGGGWIELNNRTVHLDLAGTPSQITGLDDPHIGRDDRTLLVRDPRAGFALCVVHDPAPYLDAAAAGFDLIVAGHTHGGQVRLPGVGAVVTNSTLPRGHARWLSRVDGAWLFVTPGLGTGKYAPFRFLCPPEASILELSARRPAPASPA